MPLPRSANAKARPMKKQPARFTMSVPHGKRAPKSFTASKDTPYRLSAPMLPPNITNNTFVITPYHPPRSMNWGEYPVLRPPSNTG